MSHFSMVVAVVLGLVALTGCTRKKDRIDIKPLQTSFQQTETQTKSDIQNAIAALEKERHSEALAYLNKVAANAKMTAEQQQTLRSTIDQISALMKKKAEQARQAAQKAVQPK